MFGFNPLYVACIQAIGGPQPTFSADFTAGAMRGDLTFTRASNAMQFDSLGRLVWAPANLAGYSETFGSAGWTANGTPVITTVGDAPPGFSSSFELTTTTTNHGYFGALGINRNVTVGVPYIFSAWVKSISGTAAIIFSAGSGTITVPTTTSWTRVSGLVVPTNQAAAIGAGTGGGVMRVAGFQIEPVGVDSPKAYNPTTSSAYYGPRLDYSPTTLSALGILIEESRTNSVKNSGMAGAGVGVLPTGWSAASVNGVTTSVLGVGTEDGMPYVDIQLSGVALATASSPIEFGVPADTAASNGQQWSGSVYIRRIAGTNTSVNTILQVIEGNPGFLGNGTLNIASSLGASSLRLNRQIVNYVNVNAGTTNERLQVSAAYVISEVVDITLRIACPQLEFVPAGGSAFPTSPIVTYGTAATRAEETLSTPTTGWIASNTGAMFAQFSQPYVDSSASSRGVVTMDGNARWIYTIQGAVRAYDGTTVRAGPVYTANTSMKAILALVGGNMRQSVNGGAVGVTAFDGTMTPNATLQIGSQFGATTKLNGWVAKVAYYPMNLTDSQLQAMTT